MRKVTVVTPENIEVEYELADLGSRAAAAVMDLSIQFAVLTVLAVVCAALSAFAPELWEEQYGWILGIGLLVWFAFNCGYFIFTEVAMNGQTYGKRLLRIRVIRMNGQPITLKHSAIRNLFKIFLEMQGIGVCMIFFSKHCRRLGDLAASTVVISEASQNAPVSLSSLGVGVDKLAYYLTDEEQAILRAWLERRGRLVRPEPLRRDLRAHLERKFAGLGLGEEFQTLLKQI